MAFPHQKPRKDNCGNEDKPSWSGVLGSVFKGAIDITRDGNRENDVNPAEDRALGGLGHDFVVYKFVMVLAE